MQELLCHRPKGEVVAGWTAWTEGRGKKEPDPYLAQVYRFGLLEDFEHLYWYSALMDRLQGKTPMRSSRVAPTSSPAGPR
jgi:hypothetical protein